MGMSVPAPPLLQAEQILANMPTMGNAMNLHIALTALIRRTAPPHPALHHPHPLLAEQILADMPMMGNAMNLHIALPARIRRTAPPRLVTHSMVVAKIYLLLLVDSVVLMNNPVAKLFRAAHGRMVPFPGVLARDGPHTMLPHAVVESVTTMSQQRIRQYLFQSPHIARHC